MSLFSVNPEKEKKLTGQMEKLGIRETDLIEKFIRSGGKGGQNVNKTSTCVYLEHIPTGLSVKMQKERSQSLNRFFARRLLFEKIENQLFKEKSESRKKIEKIKRQKRKRSKRAKEKMLQDKKLHSVKKDLRKSVSFEA
ncbi:MAG: peptide chain release factor-like protein [bacterium]|nr:peptide chain release factor-like protein [bacterium]